MSNHLRCRPAAAFLALGAMSFLACKQAAPPAFPPPEVAVIEVKAGPVPEEIEFMGSVEASRSVEVRSQVTGVIVGRSYVEGSAVHRGDPLFKIDPVPYDAAWRSAKGRLADAQARLKNAESNAARMRSLAGDNAIAKRELDDAEAELARAQAGVEEEQGAVDRAKKDLDDTMVRAELDGRAGRANLVLGDRVTGPGDVLTTIDALDPAYVWFRPSAQQVLSWRRNPASARALAPGGAARIQVMLPDGSTLPRTGRIDFIDPAVEPATGTQRYRAAFGNPDRLLLPGQFVRVRVTGVVRDSAIVVPQRAVLQGMGRLTVYVVASGDTVRARDVTATSWTGGEWLIEKGLAPGDRVIVDGVQKVGPGLKVHPVPAQDSSAAAAGAPGGAGAGEGSGSPAVPPRGGRPR